MIFTDSKAETPAKKTAATPNRSVRRNAIAQGRNCCYDADSASTLLLPGGKSVINASIPSPASSTTASVVSPSKTSTTFLATIDPKVNIPGLPLVLGYLLFSV